MNRFVDEDLHFYPGGIAPEVVKNKIRVDEQVLTSQLVN